MTREELKAHCKNTIEICKFLAYGIDEKLNNNKIYQEHKLILELLEQEDIMTKFSMFTDEELDVMEETFCNGGLKYLAMKLLFEIRGERECREYRESRRVCLGDSSLCVKADSEESEE